MAVKIISAGEAEAVRRSDPDLLLLDVRTPREFAACRIRGAVLIPVDELAGRYQELDPRRRTICVCAHGIRSEIAAEFLVRHDFCDVSNLRGGMAQWAGETEHD